MEDRALADFFSFSGRYVGKEEWEKLELSTISSLSSFCCEALAPTEVCDGGSLQFSPFCGARAPSLLWRREKRGKNEAIYFCNVSCDLRFRARAKTVENVCQANYFFVLYCAIPTFIVCFRKAKIFFLFQLHFFFGVGNAVMLLSPNGIWRKMGEREKVFFF